MKIPLSLIKEFIDTELPVEKIADYLTMAGLEVEKIENAAPSFSGVVAAQIEDVKKHPDSDHLTLTTVFDGTQKYPIVCGASNCRKKMIVALAKEGATLTDSSGNVIKIKQATLRGEKSFGMLVSAKELNLYDDHEGILELPDSFALGQDLSILAEPIFDIALTPNLGHCQSALGIARELSALTGLLLKPVDLHISASSIKSSISVEIDDTDNCLRYSMRLMENIKVGPSPFWLVKMLRQSNLNTVNNVVDILNYVTLLYGQPMHAFDYKKIKGAHVRVDKSKKPVEFECLDKKTRTIPQDALFIYDSEKPIALAGIIGGNNSAIDENTATIAIEAAYFNPLIIGKTQRALKLTTESSMRFEKGTDPNQIIHALNYACNLIAELCQGTIDEKLFDSHPTPIAEKQLSCRLSKTNHLLGTKLSLNEMENIFSKLGFASSHLNEETLQVKVPFYRHDINIETDLIEEIGRIYGFNNIPKKKPRFKTSTIAHSPFYLFQKKLTAFLTGEQLQEVITADLISPSAYKVMQYEEAFDAKEKIEVMHAKSSEHSILRPSHLPSFLEIAKTNQDFKTENLAIFEISHIHYRKDNKIIEQPSLAILLMGTSAPFYWQEKTRKYDFYDLKGILSSLLKICGIEQHDYRSSSHPSLHPGSQSDLYMDDIFSAVFGEIHPTIVSAYDLKQKVYFAQVNLQTLFEKRKDQTTYKKLSMFPSSERDWTVCVTPHFPVGKILSLSHSQLADILESIELIDIYQTDEMKNLKKNVTFRFIYRGINKTLQYEEVEKAHQNVLEKISSEFKKHILS